MSESPIKINPDELEWEGAHGIMPHLPEPDGDYGMWVKILRRPHADGGCWCYLLRVVPEPGKAIRLVARAASDEEVYFLSGGFSDRSGTLKQFSPMYVCNPEGLVHGGIIREETTQFVHFHGGLDIPMEYEVLDLKDVPAGAEAE